MRTLEDRMRLISIVLIGVTAIILIMMVYSMVLQHPDADVEVTESISRPYAVWDVPWGVIMDRKGELISGILPRYNLDVDRSWITDTAQVAKELAPLVHKDPRELEEMLTLSADEMNDRYAWHVRIAYHLTYEEMRAIQIEQFRDRWGIDRDTYWIWPPMSFQQTWKRDYPEGNMLGHVLGYANLDGVGVGGVEEDQQLRLRPASAYSIGELDAYDGSPFPETILQARDVGQPGIDVYLTIDRTIQAYIEDELERTLAEYNAKSGTIIVMEVKTGNILAIANWPGYYPGDYEGYKDRGEEAIFINPAISHVYEPGSVFKPLTVAAGYDSGSIPPNWSYVDVGQIFVDGVRVPNALGLSYGPQDVQGVLDHSLNAGVATIATQLIGKDTFYKYVEAFGFGYPTGVELAGEETGIVNLPRDNNGINYEDLLLANNSFGQSIAVTPLQMINAMNVIANGGELLQPHIIQKWQPADGPAELTTRQPLRPDSERVLSPETAELMRNMMQHVVDESITTAQVPGYKVAGKTGTAQVPNEAGVYDPDKVITSFVGFGPMPDPEVIILVKIDEPGIANAWGTTTAAPAFSRIAQRVFLLLGFAPDDTEQYNAALTNDL